MGAKTRPTRQEQARRRKENQAKFWNAKQAAATTPQERVAVWFDACRMLAVRAERNGDTSVSERLASHLHDFFRSNST